MLQDCKGMYLQPGMYIVYAGMYADSLDIRIARIREIKTNDQGEEYLSVHSVVKEWNGTYERKGWNLNNKGKLHALKNMDGVFAVHENHIPDEVQHLLE